MVTCSKIWFWRNKKNHEDNYRRPIQPYREIIKEIQEINKAFEKAYLVGKVRARRLGQVGWKPPPKGWLKLNVDGASVANAGKAGCGSLLRDENGKWIAGFTHTIGNCSAFIAELWGVVQGLNLARRLGMKKIMVECDSEGVVKEGNKCADCLARKSIDLDFGFLFWDYPFPELVSILQEDEKGATLPHSICI
ncbi:hypothetical protein AHAS_Ahas06G0082400 [Arachis hypogaea]